MEKDCIDVSLQQSSILEHDSSIETKKNLQTKLDNQNFKQNDQSNLDKKFFCRKQSTGYGNLGVILDEKGDFLINSNNLESSQFSVEHKASMFSECFDNLALMDKLDIKKHML